MSTFLKDCPECEGKGNLSTSDCCDASFSKDHGICSCRKDHCEGAECDICYGTGLVSKTKEEIQEDKATEDYENGNNFNN